jgi:undecaprenyl-diphosphatase
MALAADLDQLILQWINGFVGINPSFDTAVRVLADWNFVRSYWLGAVVIWAWFQMKDPETRLKVISGMAGLLAATGLSRLIQAIMPVHARPFNFITELGLHEPANLDTHWGAASSFPSDTATLHFALAAIIYSISKRWGVAAFIWVALIVSLPRVYILYHWPSDVIGGLILGVGAVAYAQRFRQVLPQFSDVLTAERIEPGLFYPVVFAVMYQVVDSFAAVELLVHQLATLGMWVIHASND